MRQPLMKFDASSAASTFPATPGISETYAEDASCESLIKLFSYQTTHTVHEGAACTVWVVKHAATPSMRKCLDARDALRTATTYGEFHTVWTGVNRVPETYARDYEMLPHLLRAMDRYTYNAVEFATDIHAAVAESVHAVPRVFAQGRRMAPGRVADVVVTESFRAVPLDVAAYSPYDAKKIASFLYLMVEDLYTKCDVCVTPAVLWNVHVHSLDAYRKVAPSMYHASYKFGDAEYRAVRTAYVPAFTTLVGCVAGSVKAYTASLRALSAMFGVDDIVEYVLTEFEYARRDGLFEFGATVDTQKEGDVTYADPSAGPKESAPACNSLCPMVVKSLAPMSRCGAMMRDADGAFKRVIGIYDPFHILSYINHAMPIVTKKKAFVTSLLHAMLETKTKTCEDVRVLHLAWAVRESMIAEPYPGARSSDTLFYAYHTAFPAGIVTAMPGEICTRAVKFRVPELDAPEVVFNNPMHCSRLPRLFYAIHGIQEKEDPQLLSDY